MNDVRTYYEFGVHRTGSEPDLKTADWLASRLSQAKLKVSRHSWEVDQYIFDGARIGFEELSLDTFPLWYSPATPPAGLSGKLIDLTDDQACSSCSPDHIGLVNPRNNLDWWLEFRRNSFMAGKLKALLVISPDRSGEGQIQAQNIPPSDVGIELPFPVLLVNANDLEFLESRVGDTVSIFLNARIEPKTRASNVIGTLERGPEWVVISTPYSGWFRCAGERGPGVALLLHLAQWAWDNDSPYSYFFVANSGHELGFLGARELLKSGLLPEPAETAAWLHLGASIATPVWREGPNGLRPDEGISQGRLQMTDDSFKPLLTSTFNRISALNPDSDDLVGELVNVKAHGYRGFGLVGGGNIHFHTKDDTPVTVSASSLSAIARALTETLEQLHIATDE
jgi:hypothetical protein